MTRTRIGFIGAGWWATQNHIPAAIRTGKAELAAVCRLGQSELARVRDAFGFAYATESVDELLEEVPLDGVVITSPHGLHFEHAIKALRAKLHVMVEKPMTTSTRDAQMLVAAAASQGKQILIPHGWNFRPCTSRARELVQSGAIGEVRHVALEMASPAESLFSGKPYPGTEQAMFRPPPSTWADPACFGGYGWGQLPHLLAWLFRVTELHAETVYAVAGTSPTGVDIFNAATIRFANDATGSISGAGTVPMGSPFQFDIRLFGTAGMLLFDMERERLALRTNDAGSEDFPIAPGCGKYECEEPVRRFIDIASGIAAQNDASGEVGLRSVEVIDALYRSLSSGGPEHV